MVRCVGVTGGSVASVYWDVLTACSEDSFSRSPSPGRATTVLPCYVVMDPALHWDSVTPCGLPWLNIEKAGRSLHSTTVIWLLIFRLSGQVRAAEQQGEGRGGTQGEVWRPGGDRERAVQCSPAPRSEHLPVRWGGQRGQRPLGQHPSLQEVQERGQSNTTLSLSKNPNQSPSI